MANDEQYCRLADLASGVSYGFTASANSNPVGPKFLRITDIQNGVVNWQFVPYCEIPEGKLDQYLLRSGDIVVARTGNSTGENYIYTGVEPTVFASYLVRFRINPKIADPFFIWYQMRSPSWWSFVASSKTGSAQAGANAQVLGRYPIRLVPLSEQKAIAHILGTLDDKIELNRKMNETLEGIAQTIFKSWFIDFDPVKAKAEGRKPIGMGEEIAALFPDSFEDSELGKIPRSWVVTMIDEVAHINARTLSQKTSLEFIDYIEISEVMRGDVAKVTKYRRGEEPSRARRQLQHGDTVLSTVRPDRGAYFLSLTPPDTLIASTGFAVITPKNGGWAFLHTFLTQPEIGELLGHLADGGAYPAIRPEVVGTLQLTVPQDSRITNEFNRLVQPFYEKAAKNRTQVISLSTTRDTLLPKLISGEIRIKDAEKLVLETT